MEHIELVAKRISPNHATVMIPRMLSFEQAEYIVEACNNYQRLQDILKEMVEVLEDECGKITKYGKDRIIAKAKELIK